MALKSKRINDIILLFFLVDETFHVLKTSYSNICYVSSQAPSGAFFSGNKKKQPESI